MMPKSALRRAIWTTRALAIKVLAGVLKPNFENYEQESTYRDLINHFKGTEAQSYFEKLEKGEITISYKPQQVELIPKSFTGKVVKIVTSTWKFPPKSQFF